MISFLQAYWVEIIIVVLSFVSVIFSVIRFKPSKAADDVKLMIAEVLPGFINLAELSGVHGKAKLLFVVESIMKRIRKYISSRDSTYWMEYITEQIENILSTPQKKEVNYEKE